MDMKTGLNLKSRGLRCSSILFALKQVHICRDWGWVGGSFFARVLSTITFGKLLPFWPDFRPASAAEKGVKGSREDIFSPNSAASRGNVCPLYYRQNATNYIYLPNIRGENERYLLFFFSQHFLSRHLQKKIGSCKLSQHRKRGLTR